MRAILPPCICAVLAIPLLLAGCGGGGRSMQTSALMQPAGSFSTDQATLLAQNMAWLPILFPVSFNPGSGSYPSDIPGPVQNPDGSFTWIFTDSDGSHQTWQISADGNTYDGRIVYVDGKVATEHLAATTHPDGSMTSVYNINLPDGSVLASVYQIPAYSNVPDRVLNTQTGTMTTPSGHVISFTCEAHVGRMLLTVDGHEGWVYALTAPMAQAIDLPDTTKPATGTFTRGTQVTSFTLPANPGGAQWNAMTLTAPGGITGTYALTLPLTGTGTVKQAGQILMTVQWGGSGAVTATMADGLSEVGEPSGAARDFLVDRWLWALADAGPNPR